MNAFCETIAEAVAGGGSGPLLAHTDALRSRAAIMPITDFKTMLPRHIEALEFIAGPRALQFPVFNYDYLRTRRYDATEAPSQVGPLTEHARTQWAEWRVGAPVFNVVGRGPKPEGIQEAGEVDPFGPQSVFAHLHRSGGDVLLYGATLASLTAIHYIERLSGGPLYRYDKVFEGVLVRGEAEEPVRFVYHCRPMGQNLDYDFPRLIVEAEEAGALVRLRAPGSEVGFVRLSSLCDFWLDQLRQDPLYLLDAPSREWVAPMLDRLGRRFVLTDFE